MLKQDGHWDYSRSSTCVFKYASDPQQLTPAVNAAYTHSSLYRCMSSEG